MHRDARDTATATWLALVLVLALALVMALALVLVLVLVLVFLEAVRGTRHTWRAIGSSKCGRRIRVEASSIMATRFQAVQLHKS